MFWSTKDSIQPLFRYLRPSVADFPPAPQVRNFVSPGVLKFVRETLSAFPRPDREAARVIRRWASQHGQDIDPDQVDAVTLHYQKRGQRWIARVVERMSMTQALLNNWQGEGLPLFGGGYGLPWATSPLPEHPILIDPQLEDGNWEPDGAYQIYNGLFKRSASNDYGRHNLVSLPAQGFTEFIWAEDFHTAYRKMLDAFWLKGLSRYRQCAQISFIAASNKQVLEDSLSNKGQALALQAAGVRPRPRHVTVHALNVYGYSSTSLLYARNSQSGLILLYIPGNSSPLHEFSNERQMKSWFATQCKDPDARDQLLHHFAPADLPDGLSYSGVETALQGLAVFPHSFHLSPNRPGFTTSGQWDPQTYIDYRAETYSPALHGDMFQILAERQKARAYADADALITTRGQLRKAKWRGYLVNALAILAPLALAHPLLGVLFAAASIAQFGLGVDQLINGRSAEAKAEGIEALSYGLLNALPSGAFKPFRAWRLFELKSPQFIRPRRINNHLGYPLSGDPALAAQALSPLQQAFEFPTRFASLDAESPVGRLIHRFKEGNGTRLKAYLHPETEEWVDVEYDAATNLFVHTQGTDTAYYKAEEWPVALNRVDTPPAPDNVTPAQRQATLQGLGIDLQQPLDLSGFQAIKRSQIPKQVSSLWIGNARMGEHYLQAIEQNASVLAGSQFRYQLFLGGDASAYEHNLRTLVERAPGLEVLKLEEQPFFKAFEGSKYYPQYEAATDARSVARNYSSASDILRYRLLRHEGGIYLDCDDFLDIPGKSPAEVREQLEQLELSTTAKGLILNEPMSSALLGMDNEFNTSLIGSHAGNPTLDAISDEILLRYEQFEPDFYTASEGNPVERDLDYARRLNFLTGPDVLNSIVDRELPWLQQLREAYKILMLPIRNRSLLMDVEYFEKVLLPRFMPLDDMVIVGAEHSWLST
ncbi:dermonecrotic toxin domain-containing protein [Pseudomonas sp. NPDC090755]|uniref:dermonecrotic toxin domain-containing protein n=1 Tax=Pseudomonas sp. NPDC090755 TaxID=3364481 RepID=UPI00383AD86E